MALKFNKICKLVNKVFSINIFNLKINNNKIIKHCVFLKITITNFKIIKIVLPLQEF
jgi:hypothetical protein